MTKTHQEKLNELPDGIYLNLPHDDYLKIDRISNSYLKKMRMSPGDAWKDSPMNPDREADRAEPSDALILGQAYDLAMLDPDSLMKKFIRGISKTDERYQKDGILTNGTEIGNKLAEYGLPKNKAGETVFEKAERLRAAGYPGYIWVLEEEGFKNLAGDRVVIDGKCWDNLIRDVGRVHAIPEIKDMLVGGITHPVILWTREDGIRCKCELDKLHRDKIVDLKSFENTNEKPLEDCVRDAIRYRGYYRQAVWYWTACRAVVTQDLKIMDADEGPAHEIIQAIKDRGYSLEFYYVFQQKSGVPNCIARRFKFFNHDLHNDGGVPPEKQEELAEKHGFQSALCQKAMVEINKAIADYKKYFEIYGVTEPWQYLNVVADLDDEEFNEFWLREEA